jgi:hypothetical protein
MMPEPPVAESCPRDRKVERAGGPSPTGVTWGRTQVHRMLQHPGYLGQAFAFRTRSRREDGKWVQEKRPREEWVRLPDEVMPALVRPDTWERVQQVLEHNRQRRSAVSSHDAVYLLRGHLLCATCASIMYAAPSLGRRYYRCSLSMTGQRGADDPKHAHIEAERIEADVWGLVSDALAHPEFVREQFARERSPDPTGDSLDILRTALADLEEKARACAKLQIKAELENATEYVKGLYAEEMATLESRRKGLLDQRDLAEQRQASWRAAQERTTEVEERLRAISADLSQATFADRRAALEALDIQVVVDALGTGRGARSRKRWHVTGRIRLAEGPAFSASLDHHTSAAAWPSGASPPSCAAAAASSCPAAVSARGDCWRRSSASA